MSPIARRAMVVSVATLLGVMLVMPTTASAVRLHKRVDVRAKAADIRGVLGFLGRQGRVNIVTTDSVRGTVTLHLKRVTVANALRAVVAVGGWVMERTDNVIIVMTRAEQLKRLDERRRRR